MPNMYTDEGFWLQQPDFLALEQRSTTDPCSHFTSGPECYINVPLGDTMPGSCQASKSNHGSVVWVPRPSNKDADPASAEYLNFGSINTIPSVLEQSSSSGYQPARSQGKNLKFQVTDELRVNQSKAINSINWKHCRRNLCFEKDNMVDNQAIVLSHGLESQAPSKLITSGTTAMTKKQRIRWTEDLHNQFVECVNRLGGADMATPMGIHKLMNREGLTIFHVKSHLQKYRAAQYTPNSKKGRKAKTNTSSMPARDLKMGTPISKALRIQADVVRCLCEQLESQRNLQLQIEEQAKQLKEIFDRQFDPLMYLKKNHVNNSGQNCLFAQFASSSSLPI